MLRGCLGQRRYVRGVTFQCGYPHRYQPRWFLRLEVLEPLGSPEVIPHRGALFHAALVHEGVGTLTHSSSLSLNAVFSLVLMDLFYYGIFCLKGNWLIFKPTSSPHLYSATLHTKLS